MAVPDLVPGVDFYGTALEPPETGGGVDDLGRSFQKFRNSTTQEEGAAVGTGFGQGAFAAGGTDIELASDDEWQTLASGPVRGLGFQVDQIERARASLRAHE